MTVVEETAPLPVPVPVPVPAVTDTAPVPVEQLPDVPRRVGGLTRSGVLSLFGAAASGLCVAVLLFGELAPFSGALGFTVTAYLAFLAVYAVLTSLEENGQAVLDRVMTVVLWTAASLLFLALALVVGFTAWRGREALPHGNFFTQDMQAAGPLDPLSNGGIAHAMLGSLIMIAIALLITVPLGLACAVYLNQIPGRFSRFVRTIVEAMTALPSIVAGLMVYATWILGLGMQKSGLAAGFAISVMMLPIVIRASDVVLRLVPGTLTEAAEALGAPRWRTVWHVVLPTARSGLATAVILGTARGIGETSPVLLTAGFTAALNGDPTSGPMISLPLAVFNFVKSPEPAMIARGFGAAAVLMALVLVLFAIARVIGGRGPGHQTKRQARGAARASRRDTARFAELHTPGLSLFEGLAQTEPDHLQPTSSEDAVPTGSGDAVPTGSDAAVSAGSGAMIPTGSESTASAGSGATAPTGSESTVPDASVSTSPAGSGGAAPTGSGATAPTGTESTVPDASVSTSPAGSGGAAPAGSGGAAPAGSGTVPRTGAPKARLTKADTATGQESGATTGQESVDVPRPESVDVPRPESEGASDPESQGASYPEPADAPRQAPGATALPTESATADAPVPAPEPAPGDTPGETPGDNV